MNKTKAELILMINKIYEVCHSEDLDVYDKVNYIVDDVLVNWNEVRN